MNGADFDTLGNLMERHSVTDLLEAMSDIALLRSAWLRRKSDESNARIWQATALKLQEVALHSPINRAEVV